jgi:O-antigen/teichoic acid export membrane protein
MLLISQFSMYALALILFFRTAPEIHIRWAYASWKTAKEMLRYGMHTLTSSIGQLLQTRSAPVLIPYFLPLRYLAYYAVSVKLLDYVSDGLARIGMVTVPNAAELMASKEKKALVNLGVYTNRYCVVIFAPLAIFLLNYRLEALSLWIRPDFAAECAYLLPAMLIGEFAMAGQTNSVSILFGMGQHKISARFQVAEAIAATVGGALVLPRWGLYGLVWVRSICMFANRGVALCVLTAKQLEIHPLVYAWRIYGVPLAISAFVCAAEYWFKLKVAPGRSWLEIAIGTAFMGLLYVPLSWRFAILPHHREMLVDQVRRLLRIKVQQQQPA